MEIGTTNQDDRDIRYDTRPILLFILSLFSLTLIFPIPDPLQLLPPNFSYTEVYRFRYCQ